MMERGKIIVVLLSAAVIFYVVIGGILGKVGATDDPYRPLLVFNEVLKKVLDEYVDKPDISKLTDGALQGLAYGVDSFSSYLSPADYRMVKEKMNSPATTGIVISPRMGYYRVMQVLPGSPAEQAGIYSGDVISEIDGIGTSEKSYPYVVAMLRGEPGSSVKVGVIRGQEEQLSEFILRRESLPPAALVSRILEPGIGYIKIVEIHEKTPAEIHQALNTLASSEASMLLLDLRDCSIGSYQTAIDVANLFIEKGTIVTRKGHPPLETTFIAKADQMAFRGRLAVLINGYTGGPAEIIATAVQDNGRGKLIGIKTCGIASEQKFFELEDSAALFLTYVRYHTQAGRSIINEKFNLSGIKPDVKSPPEDYALSQYIDYEMATGKDSIAYFKKYVESVYAKQLEQAVETLKGTESPAAKPAA